MTASGKINGFDITRYATDPTHEQRIAAMTSFIELHLVDPSAEMIDEFILHRAPRSPLTGEMFLEARNKYNLVNEGLWLMIALIQNDTMYGTKGEGAHLHNPGNVGDDDEGHTKDWGDWRCGVQAVANWLDKHRC